MGESDNVKCAECGSSFNRMFLMGKQGNANVCPMCGGKSVSYTHLRAHETD